MKKFERPELTVQFFTTEDVLTTSTVASDAVPQEQDVFGAPVSDLYEQANN